MTLAVQQGWDGRAQPSSGPDARLQDGALQTLPHCTHFLLYPAVPSRCLGNVPALPPERRRHPALHQLAWTRLTLLLSPLCPSPQDRRHVRVCPWPLSFLRTQLPCAWTPAGCVLWPLPSSSATSLALGFCWGPSSMFPSPTTLEPGTLTAPIRVPWGIPRHTGMG